MKIAIVSDAIYPHNKGGKEKRIFELATRYAAAGHEVHLLTMRWWKGPRVIREHGMTLHAVCSLQPLYTSEGRRSLREAIVFGCSIFFPLLFGRFDLIEVDHIPYLPIFSGRIVAWLRRTPLIATWHEVWGRKAWTQYLGGWKAWLATLIEWGSVKLPDRIISVSPLTTRRLQEEFRVSSKKILTVPNGIALDLIDHVAPAKEKSDLIFAGRLLKHKNIDLAIRALARLKKEARLTPTFFVIGDGPERGALEKLTKQLGLESQIRFFGFVEDERDVYALMKASQLCFSPSSREGFGILAVEAQACGLPVLTVDVPENAMKDLIRSGENGWVVPLDEKAITSMIKKLLSTTSLLIASRSKAQDRIQGSDWASISQRILTFLDDTMKHQKRVAPSVQWNIRDIFLGILLGSIGVVLGLGLIQDGSFYALDGGVYHNYVNQFLNKDFDLSHSIRPSFPSSYALFVTPFVWFLSKLDFSVSFAMRSINVIAFGLTGSILFFLSRFFLYRSFSFLASILFLFGTPAIVIAIDIWPQPLGLLFGISITAASILYYLRPSWGLLYILEILIVSLIYIRPFEVIFYWPQYLLVIWQIIKLISISLKKWRSNIPLLFQRITIFLSLLLVLILPLFYFNLSNYGNIFGYYVTEASRQAHFFYDFAWFRFHELVFHFWRHDGTIANRPTLSILEASPFLVFSFFGLFSLFAKRFIGSLVIFGTLITGFIFYTKSNLWNDPWAPSMRFLTVLFPYLCLLSVSFVQDLFYRLYSKRAMLAGVGLMFGLATGLLGFFWPFFKIVLVENIGIWSFRVELKTLSHYINGTLFAMGMLSVLLLSLGKRIRMNIATDFLIGLIFCLFGLSLFQGFYTNIIAAALSIRYGENVFSYFWFPFLARFFDYTFVKAPIPFSYKGFFWFVVFVGIYSLGSLVFVKQKDISP